MQKSEEVRPINRLGAVCFSREVEHALLTIDRVENSGLAERLLVLSCRVAAVITVLMTTNASVRVGLIWLLRERG